MSVFDNIAYGLRLQGLSDQRALERRWRGAAVRRALGRRRKIGWGGQRADPLRGQQQRLVIARAIAIALEVLLLDELASAFDPISTLKIEELIGQLAEAYSIIVVTHNMQQAARVSDYTAFLYLGELVQFSATDDFSTWPQARQTEDYITGRHGQEPKETGNAMREHISGQYRRRAR